MEALQTLLVAEEEATPGEPEDHFIRSLRPMETESPGIEHIMNVTPGQKQLWQEAPLLSPQRWYDAFVPRWDTAFYEIIGDERYRLHKEALALNDDIRWLHERGNAHTRKLKMMMRDINERRKLIRDCILILVYVVLLVVPVLSQLTWSPVLDGDCSGPPTPGAKCLIQPHSYVDMGWACAMLLLTKTLLIDDSNGFCSMCDQFCDKVVAQKKDPGDESLKSRVEWFLAIFNSLTTLTFVGCQTIRDYSHRFTNSELYAVTTQTSQEETRLVLVRDPAHQTDITQCLQFSSYEELVAATQSYFGGCTLLLFMVGVLSLSMSEIMKKAMDPSSNFILKKWIHVGGFSQINSELQKSQWMLKLTNAKNNLIQASKKAEDQKQSLVSSFVSCCGLLTWPQPIANELKAKGDEMVEEIKTNSIEQLKDYVDIDEDTVQMKVWVLKADSERQLWLSVLQAFAFALFVPLDYVILDPCLRFNDEIETSVLFGLVQLGDASGHGFVPPAQQLAVCAILLCMFIVLLSKALEWCALRGAQWCCSTANAIFWVLLIYTVVCGTFIVQLQRDAADRRLAGIMKNFHFNLDMKNLHFNLDYKRLLGWQPLNFLRILLVVNFLQWGFREFMARMNYRCWQPSPKELQALKEHVMKPIRQKYIDEVIIEAPELDDRLNTRPPPSPPPLSCGQIQSTFGTGTIGTFGPSVGGTRGGCIGEIVGTPVGESAERRESRCSIL
eukprot:TRINITY_DN11247_c0_g2_i1.p1 TRINITY_DN11247_c0_g2~~TRINITY_DN11247_c0_g2_i1.p1  ORF type:complete len:791 (-),score=138.95 TRINITY_DN11247_c0_g2_i1:196-2373(-)